jgi:hypothetical protein
MKKIEHKFYDKDIEKVFISEISAYIVEIDFYEPIEAVVLTINDIEAIVNKMGKRLVDYQPIRVYPEYNGWTEEE